MAKYTFTQSLAAIRDGFYGLGHAIGARRFLFVWSAICVAVSLYFGITGAISLYSTNFVTNMGTFLLSQILGTALLFAKIFSPMFILVVAIKYIFDGNDGHPSETLKVSLFVSILFGLFIGMFAYLDAGHIVGNNIGMYCEHGARCWFSWPMLWMACKMFLGSMVGMLALIIGFRGIYNELSFMLSKNK